MICGDAFLKKKIRLSCLSVIQYCHLTEWSNIFIVFNEVLRATRRNELVNIGHFIVPQHQLINFLPFKPQMKKTNYQLHYFNHWKQWSPCQSLTLSVFTYILRRILPQWKRTKVQAVVRIFNLDRSITLPLSRWRAQNSSLSQQGWVLISKQR